MIPAKFAPTCSVGPASDIRSHGSEARNLSCEVFKWRANAQRSLHLQNSGMSSVQYHIVLDFKGDEYVQDHGSDSHGFDFFGYEVHATIEVPNEAHCKEELEKENVTDQKLVSF